MACIITAFWLWRLKRGRLKRLADEAYRKLISLQTVLQKQNDSGTAVPNNVDLVFGFGSLIDDESRLSSLSHNCRAAILCEVRGFVRSWCFRSDTGFTAIGGFQAQSKGDSKIPGVIFPAGADMASLDRRERGYHRVQVALEDVRVVASERNVTCDCEQKAGPSSFRRAPKACGPCSICNAGILHQVLDVLQRTKDSPAGVTPRIWVYLPDEDHIRPVAMDYPICQTYVDVVLNGCIEWGGEEMARTFCLTTEGWSHWWLNDANLSRRPWLHRKPRWREIDDVLEKLAPLTCFYQRKHSEDYAAACSGFLARLKEDQNAHEKRRAERQAATEMASAPGKLPDGATLGKATDATGPLVRSNSLPDVSMLLRAHVPEEVRFHGLT